MDRWEAREVIRRHDPEVAARLDVLDPLGPPPAPCTCDPEDMAEVSSWGSAEVLLVCAGACRPRRLPNHHVLGDRQKQVRQPAAGGPGWPGPWH